MSYIVGIGESQQPADAVPVADAGRTSATAKAEPGALWQPSSAAVEIAGDTATVSLAGAMISQATMGSDVRFDKVAALRESIEAGTYNVPSAAVAGRLIDAMQK